MLSLFNQPWSKIPIVFVDVETTGLDPWTDRVVQFAIVRFESGQNVAEYSSLVNPCVPIPQQASDIHKITNDIVKDCVTINEAWLYNDTVQKLLKDAQPAAYNASFDKAFLPTLCGDRQWPWIDPLTLVRHVDPYVRGKGRHKLEVTCIRHGVDLDEAHDALSDARAAGHLFYMLAKNVFPEHVTLGNLLKRQGSWQNKQWHSFNEWRSLQEINNAL